MIRGVVYAQHPKQAKVLPLGGFHQEIRTEKFNEAVALMNFLGAAHIVVEHETGKSTSASTKLDGLKVVRGGAGAKVATQRSVSYESRGAGSAPRAPQGLRWMDEPGWQGACDAVLINGHTSVEISVENQSDFGVDARLAAQIKKMGLELGSEFQSARSARFVVKATFPERKRR